MAVGDVRNPVLSINSGFRRPPERRAGVFTELVFTGFQFRLA